MDPTNTKYSELNRRASMRTSVRLSMAGDEDDYEVPTAVVADGMLRPTNLPPSRQRTPSPSISRDERVPTTLTVDSRSTSRPNTAPSRPSSIAKPPRVRDSLTLRGEHGMLPPQHVLGDSALSGIEGDVIGAEAPYSGPSGPSHPYQMYPQRAVSIATVSTTVNPSERHHEPTHPYGLYPQHTTPGEAGQTSIPVGFPGIAGNYQRRLGPDGEDAVGLVGPLGHVEELPPYSRYPEEAYARKVGDEENQASLQTVAAIPMVNATNQPQNDAAQDSQTPTITHIPGAGGIGLATRDPEYSSTLDIDSPRSRLSTRSFASDNSQNSQHEINTAALAVIDEKNMSRRQRWQKKARKRIWGIIPYWAVFLLAVALIVMGIVLGTVIGVFLTRHKKGGPPSDAEKLKDDRDVVPLAQFPANLAGLDTGEYIIPPMPASQAPNLCFNISQQAQAWSCNVAMNYYHINVERIPGQSPTSDYALALTLPNSTMGPPPSFFAWGTKMPILDIPQQLILVNDTFEPAWGPAWWFQIPYNKTVVLQDDKFSATAVKRHMSRTFADGGSSGSQADHNDGDVGKDFKRKGVNPFEANPGDKAWICTWPSTLFEFFIYPQQNTSLLSHSSSSSTDGYPLAANSTGGDGSGNGDSDGDESDNPWPNIKGPPPYPKVIKISERRMADEDDPVATCEQVVVAADGISTYPIASVDGSPRTIVVIPEKKRSASGYRRRRWIEPGEILTPRDSSPPKELGDCGCLWTLQ